MKEVYTYGGITILSFVQYIVPVLLPIIGIWFYKYPQKEQNISTRRFLKIWIFFTLIIGMLSLVYNFEELKATNNALKYNKDILTVCGKTTEYTKFGINREHFKINDIFFSLDDGFVRSNYGSYEFAKDKNFKAEYIDITGNNILIRLHEVPNCKQI